jgi:hypothetical protein
MHMNRCSLSEFCSLRSTHNAIYSTNLQRNLDRGLRNLQQGMNHSYSMVTSSSCNMHPLNCDYNFNGIRSHRHNKLYGSAIGNFISPCMQYYSSEVNWFSRRRDSIWGCPCIWRINDHLYANELKTLHANISRIGILHVKLLIASLGNLTDR